MKKLSLALALLLAAGLSRPATAQEYPQQTIKFVVAFGPGGGAAGSKRLRTAWQARRRADTSPPGPAIFCTPAVSHT